MRPVGGPKYTFNYEAMKALNDDLQMRSDWVMPICTGQERLKNFDGVKAHPTQKPEGLLHRAILAATQPGDIILDPFFGTGTTGAVAKKLGRKYLGLEREAEYAEVARKRLAQIPAAGDISLLQTPSKRKEPRIPFGWLVERGLLEPGTVLHSHCHRWTAKVRADGTLIAADHRGSIHQVGLPFKAPQAAMAGPLAPAGRWPRRPDRCPAPKTACGDGVSPSYYWDMTAPVAEVPSCGTLLSKFVHRVTVLPEGSCVSPCSTIAFLPTATWICHGCRRSCSSPKRPLI